MSVSVFNLKHWKYVGVKYLLNQCLNYNIFKSVYFSCKFYIAQNHTHKHGSIFAWLFFTVLSIRESSTERNKDSSGGADGLDAQDTSGKCSLNKLNYH